MLSTFRNKALVFVGLFAFCAALVAACLGSLTLWYCHLIFTSEVMRSFSEIHAMG